MQIIWRITIVSATLIAACAFFTACTKYVPGPQGDPGAPGGKGTLKITNLTYAASSWSLDVSDKWESTFQSTKITDNVIAKGEVDVFMQIDNKWWSLPYGEGDFFMQANVEKNFVRLKYLKIHGGPPPKPDTKNFRIVVMEPVQ
jgi:hypothetical protein